jgi:hypothetical protein
MIDSSNLRSAMPKYLNGDFASARSLAPAEIEPFDGWTADQIRLRLAAAVRIAKVVQQRLNRLRGAANPQTIWITDGPEQWWFGDYSAGKVGKIGHTFNVVYQTLGHRSLKVVCKGEKPFYGLAGVAIKRIVLGALWKSNNAPVSERVQTFIHEASHIAGRVTLTEKHDYGQEASHALAGRKMKATRNADNFGYYALHVASLSP